MRAIPDDNLAYPVLVTLASGGQGSGFFVNALPAGYLATAAHVLFDESGALLSDEITLRAFPRDPEDSGWIEYHIALKTLDKAGNLLRHASHDVVALRLFTLARRSGTDGMSITGLPGVQRSATTTGGHVFVKAGSLRRFKDVQVANQVVVFGFPRSVGLKHMPQFDYQRPLLRRGIIAAKYVARRTLVLDCAVYPGNSGGPVLEIEQEGLGWHYRVAGIVAEYIPFAAADSANLSNSGYAVATSIDPLLELIGVAT